MSKKKKEKIKIYVVTVLTLVLMVLAYFRFIHKESTVVANIEPGTELHAGVDVLQAKIGNPAANVQPYLASAKEPARAFIRDIFAPVKPLPQKKRQPAEQKPAKPPPSLTLRGTIVGGGKPIAIINDKILRQGDRIDGFKVVKIGKKEVLLRSTRDQLELKLTDHD
jgi:type II secretory pathway component PulC